MLWSPPSLVAKRDAFRSAWRTLACTLGLAAFTPLYAQALSPSEALTHVRLAQDDVKTGQFARATQRFKWLLLNDTDSPQRSKTYQEALRQLTKRAPLTFKAAGALLPSTNVARSSSETVLRTDIGDFTIGDPDAKTGGVGLRVEARGTYAHAYQAGREASATLRFNTTLYDAVELRHSGFDLTLAHHWLTPGATYTMSAFAGQSIYPTVDDRTSPNSWVQGIALNAAHVLKNGHVVRLGGSWNERLFHSPQRSYANGTTATLSANYTFPVGERGNITVLGALSTANLGNDSYSYSGYTLGGVYARTHANGLSWSVGYSTSLRDYDDLFPLFSHARRDTSKTVSASISHKQIQINGMTPRLSCASKQQTSNIALYDYSSIDCSIKLQFDF
jgi:hypothetical protein